MAQEALSQEQSREMVAWPVQQHRVVSSEDCNDLVITSYSIHYTKLYDVQILQRFLSVPNVKKQVHIFYECLRDRDGAVLRLS